MEVRRLVVEECEFLQGFPRGYTNIPHRGKPAADGPRYKALGNSWAVPVAAWVGKRIQEVEATHAARKDAA
jgi:DNA (cytosine-5)-methyltransferase 1